MPIYKYYEILPDGSEGESEPLDVSQKINGPTLEVHTITRNPIKKYFFATSINTQYSDKKTKKQLNPSNLQQQGFTQYIKDKTNGKYHKSACTDPSAPDQIDPKKV